MKKFFQDFKSFAMKGNVLDMAVGVIIGGAFGKIVTSLVNDIITPLISLALGKINLTELSITLAELNGAEPILLKYGMFLQNVIDFLIIALSIFTIIRIIGRFKGKEEVREVEAAAVIEEKSSKEQELLTEIRDLLKERKD